MIRVLVTDGQERASLAVTRSLGAWTEVHVMADRKGSLSGVSRWAVREHLVPDALADSDGFNESLKNVVQEYAIDVIFPMTDRTCVCLLPIRDELPDVTIVAPDFKVYSQLSDKAQLIDIASRHGIAAPAGARVSSLSEALHQSEKICWPVVLKPLTSVSTDLNSGPVQSPAVRIVSDPEALAKAWAETKCSEVLIQRYVEGWGEGVFVLRVQGRTCAIFAHRRLREKPPGGGVSVLRESVAVDGRVLSRLEALLDEVDFEGVAMAEFRTDGSEYWLMEFNVRFWGSLQLAIDAGVDFPRLALEAFRSSSVVGEKASGFRLGVRSRWLLGDLDHALALARGRVDTKGRRGLVAALRVLFLPTGPGCRWEVLRVSDFRPFWAEVKLWLAAALRRAPSAD
ncbi:MAG: ATP-grasp domain-containing protein [Myxococcota bacterium]|nr:ATP-grasp domain-containing protein [Myxococcota bacterium]